jgi:inhibitor of KinA sporulation pathway (predicted exonuclease)
MHFIIVDLEATCWEDGTTPGRQEIIEIGAVRTRAPDFQPEDTFERFVRPTREPVLSDFCIGLTGIRPEDVTGAAPFPQVFPEFLEWIGAEPFRLASWGAYDLKQFVVELERHKLPLPAGFSRHLNLKASFAALKGVRPCGMARALAICGLPLEGRHHRALDDARNITRLAALILPVLGDEKNI